MVDGILGIYKLGCFTGTFYMIFVLFEQYYMNDDASEIHSKRFIETDRDMFPSITLCLNDDELNGLYAQDYIFSSAGLSEGLYRQALMGREFKINYSLLQDPTFFYNATINLEDYLLQFKVSALKKDRLLENFQNSASVKPNDCGIAIYILYILENHKILIFQR